MGNDTRIRTEKYLLTLLPEEKAMLEKNAFEYGLSQADYLRQLILSESLIGRHWTMDKEQGRQILYELNRIGNNVNQIAYNTNAKTFAANPDWVELKKNYFELLALIGRLPFLTKEAQEEWLTHIYMLLQQL